MSIAFITGKTFGGVLVNASAAAIRVLQTYGVKIGGSVPQARNVISGNIGNGVEIDWSSSVGVTDNDVGTATNGVTALANGGSGVLRTTRPASRILPRRPRLPGS